MAEFYSLHLSMSADNHIEDLVLNAVPDLSETSNAPWVEWFKIGEKIYHHIIFTKVKLTVEGRYILVRMIIFVEK